MTEQVGAGMPDALPWWQTGVVYQIYPRSFMDASGDGIGDLQGILRRLDYLTWLGVDAIWISPFYPSPMADMGYDISDFTGVDPTFGTLATFDALLSACHARGIRVILDFVPNHTSDQHPWFREARASRQASRRDWYVWADPRPDGAPPNNWLSIFGGPAWEYDAATAQFYLHSFLKEQPDLNWRHPAVRAAMLDVLRFWLDRGVDGFRVDAAIFIMKDPLLRDNPPAPPAYREFHKPFGAYDTQIHLYDKGHPDVHGVFRDIRTLLEGYGTTPPRLAVGEIHLFDWADWATYYGARLDELTMPFNFGLLGATWDAAAIGDHVAAIERAVPPGAWPNFVLGNHDEPRVASRMGPEQARAAMLLLLTLRGTPFLYYGDELGMRDVDVPAERAHDRWAQAAPGVGSGRDAARTPMPWDAGPHAGFCPPEATPWLPLADDSAYLNVAAEQRDPRSMLALTRAILQLRRALPALSRGTYTAIPAPGAQPARWYAYVREAEARRVLIVLSFASEGQRVSLPTDLGAARVLLSTALDRDEPVALDALALRPYEGCIIALS